MSEITDLRSLVVIPTYNERENLPTLMRDILAGVNEVDVLVVDDNSPDGTGDLAEAMSSENPRIRVLRRPGKLGLGTAYVAGFKYALARNYDRIIEMDGDLSHRPEDLPALLRASEHADVVIGSRNIAGGMVEGWSPLRHLMSKSGSMYARLLLQLPVRDCTSGFKCFRRRALESLDFSRLRSNGYAFQVEVNYSCARAGMRFAEVPILFPNRTKGASKMSSEIVLEAALLVLRLRLRLTPPAIAQRSYAESVEERAA